MSYRIAIASSSGEAVDQHFGQAKNFLIYDVLEDKVEFVEDREVRLNTDDAAHSDSNLETLASLLHDCKAVFVLKIGQKATLYLYAKGITSFAVNYSLNRIFTTLLKRQNGRIKVI
ncbi:MAG: NifB/NifX family molybdenum-iron cluster-binding protein [Paludibacteraceae bacterium]|nr:NifB/NifX family molybdenum-iron cluster-binding protein [Paludibacteraceae bacterium]